MKPVDFTDRGLAWNLRYIMAHLLCRLARKSAPNDCRVFLVEEDRIS